MGPGCLQKDACDGDAHLLESGLSRTAASVELRTLDSSPRSVVPGSVLKTGANWCHFGLFQVWIRCFIVAVGWLFVLWGRIWRCLVSDSLNEAVRKAADQKRRNRRHFCALKPHIWRTWCRFTSRVSCSGWRSDERWAAAQVASTLRWMRCDHVLYAPARPAPAGLHLHPHGQSRSYHHYHQAQCDYSVKILLLVFKYGLKRHVRLLQSVSVGVQCEFTGCLKVFL